LVTCAIPALEAQADSIISLNPAATYLHTNQDAALDDIPIDLSALGLGITPGTSIRLTPLGAFSGAVGAPDNTSGLDVYVFSSSNVLTASTNLNRVPGAIGVGSNSVTIPTLNGNQPTDIPEDFFVPGPFLDITVPAGARYLFTSVNDSLFQDNTDPDGNHALRIGVNSVPEPAAFIMAGTSVLAGLGFWWRRRRAVA
jgi:hypothetical protein